MDFRLVSLILMQYVNVKIMNQFVWVTEKTRVLALKLKYKREVWPLEMSYNIK